MSYVDKLKKICLSGLALTLIAPLLANVNFVFPFMQLKNVFFRLMMLILVIPAVLLVIKRGKIALKHKSIITALVVFIFVAIVTTIFGVNPYHSFWGNFERMDGLLNVLFLGGWFFLLSLVLEEPRSRIVLWRTSVLVSVLVGAYALANNFNFKIPGFLNGTGGTLGNIDFLGVYLMLNIFSAGIVWLLDNNSGWRKFYIGAGLFNVLAVFIIAARASILGLIAGLGVFAIFYYFKTDKLQRRYLWLVSACLAACFLLIFAFRDTALIKNVRFLNRFTSISMSDASTANRLRVWGSAWQAINERPLLGWGPENSIYGLNKFYDSAITEQWFDRAHNFILDYLLWGGIAGLAAFLGLFGAGFFVAVKNLKNNYYLAAAFMAILAAYLVNNLFSFDILAGWLILLLALASIDRLGLEKEKETEVAIPAFAVNYDFLFIGLLSLLVIVFGYIGVIRPAQANMLAADAIRYSAADPEKTLARLKQAIDLNTFGNPEIAVQAADYSLDLSGDEKKDYLLKKSAIEAAEKYSLAILQLDPGYLKGRLILAQAYEAYAPYNVFYAKEAVRLLKDHISDSPNRLEIYMILAQAYYLQGDLDNCIANLKKVLEISQERQLDYLNLINMLSQKKDIAEMERYVREYREKFKDISVADYVKLGQYYFRAGLIDEAERLLKDEAIPKYPEEFSPYIALASVYEYRGNWQLAINYCGSIAEKHPNTKPQLDEYIKYLKNKYKIK